MSRADYDRWVAAGKPFTLMRPARDLRDRLRAHGYTVYDIGNEAHLLAEPPQDHTPYSDTGWPGTAKFGYGHAIDVMPPAAGAKSRIDGLPLPSLQQLGAQLLRDRQAGVKGISWLKYMNWEPQGNYTGPCYHDAWQPSYARTASSDRGHIHLSGATGYETSDVGRGYDPVARIRGGDDVGISAEDVDRIAAAAAEKVWRTKRKHWITGHEAAMDAWVIGANHKAEGAGVAAARAVALLSDGQAEPLPPEQVAALAQTIADAIPDELAERLLAALAARLAE